MLVIYENLNRKMLLHLLQVQVFPSRFWQPEHLSEGCQIHLRQLYPLSQRHLHTLALLEAHTSPLGFTWLWGPLVWS